MINAIVRFSQEAGGWLILGLVSQVCFFSRFLVQWIVSEKRGVSFVPVSFWYLSICGACGLLIYSLYRRDPVFILGQSMGLFVYVRNLVLIKKLKQS